MPSISQELQSTRTARWYQAARNAQRAGAWDERVRCYKALSAVLAEHATTHMPEGCGQRPVQLKGIVAKVAERVHFASAQYVYKRWSYNQEGQPIVRWAGESPSVRPGAALVAEAKVTAFWPYREGVIKIADAFDMTLFEWAAAYLRALAAWAGENRPLAVCHPADPPWCVAEDMTVLAARRRYRVDEPDVTSRAARLTELAGTVIGLVLDDARITPLGAFNSVCGEVRQLLTGPSASRTGTAQAVKHRASGEPITSSRG